MAVPYYAINMCNQIVKTITQSYWKFNNGVFIIIYKKELLNYVLNKIIAVYLYKLKSIITTYGLPFRHHLPVGGEQKLLQKPANS